MSARPSLPGADVLFGKRRPTGPATEPAEPEPAKPERVTLYLSAELLAELDEYRAALRRDGVRADRGRIIRDCIRNGLVRSGELLDDLRRAER